MFATAQDVEERFNRPFSSEERTLVEHRLADVEAKIRSRIRNLDERLVAEPNLSRVIVTVQCDAVLRLLRNPEGFLQETDGNYTYMLSQEAANARLTIYPEEWADLGVRSGWGVIHVLPELPGRSRETF